MSCGWEPLPQGELAFFFEDRKHLGKQTGADAGEEKEGTERGERSRGAKHETKDIKSHPIPISPKDRPTSNQ